jgi:hypothetical protein
MNVQPSAKNLIEYVYNFNAYYTICLYENIILTNYVDHQIQNFTPLDDNSYDLHAGRYL